MSTSSKLSALFSSNNVLNAETIVGLLLLRNKETGLIDYAGTMASLEAFVKEQVTKESSHSARMREIMVNFLTAIPAGQPLSVDLLAVQYHTLMNGEPKDFAGNKAAVKSWVEANMSKTPKVLCDEHGEPILNERGKKTIDPCSLFSRRGKNGGTFRWASLSSEERAKTIKSLADSETKRLLTKQAKAAAKAAAAGAGAGATATDELDDDTLGLVDTDSDTDADSDVDSDSDELQYS